MDMVILVDGWKADRLTPIKEKYAKEKEKN